VRVWLDAQLPLALTPWVEIAFGVPCVAIRDLGLRDAEDQTIFDAARAEHDVVILSKDSDFVDLVLRLGPPPQILWLTCDNVINPRLQRLLTEVLPDAMALLAAGDAVVEIGDRLDRGSSRASHTDPKPRRDPADDAQE
jgi:predicted nuclease of predicted toxin-antitoxin system